MPPPDRNLAKQLARAGASPSTALRLARHPEEARAMLLRIGVKKLTAKKSGPPPVRVPGPSTIQ